MNLKPTCQTCLDHHFICSYSGKTPCKNCKGPGAHDWIECPACKPTEEKKTILLAAGTATEKVDVGQFWVVTMDSQGKTNLHLATPELVKPTEGKMVMEEKCKHGKEKCSEEYHIDGGCGASVPVCHCGSLFDAHSEASGHAFQAMDEPPSPVRKLPPADEWEKEWDERFLLKEFGIKDLDKSHVCKGFDCIKDFIRTELAKQREAMEKAQGEKLERIGEAVDKMVRWRFPDNESAADHDFIDTCDIYKSLQRMKYK